jgi:hypothetical protein
MFACYFKGDTPAIDQTEIDKAKENWRALDSSAKQTEISRAREKANRKRESIGENAARCNFLLAGLAFIIGAAITVMLFVSTSTPSQIVLQVSASIILFATSFLLLTIAPKAKVMRKKLDYVPTAFKGLVRARMAQELYASDEQMLWWYDFETEAVRLHKCEFILLVERRAIWLATMILISALMLMVVGINIR